MASYHKILIGHDTITTTTITSLIFTDLASLLTNMMWMRLRIIYSLASLKAVTAKWARCHVTLSWKKTLFWGDVLIYYTHVDLMPTKQ